MSAYSEVEDFKCRFTLSTSIVDEEFLYSIKLKFKTFTLKQNGTGTTLKLKTSNAILP